jgi:nitronate monooxygenase
MALIESRPHPILIQGGMGVAVSGWELARAVSLMGQLGVVSGTAIDTVLARRLQLGDGGGHVRRAMAQFPYPGMVQRILDRYFISGGKPSDTPFRPTPVLPVTPSQEQTELVVVANFVEVFLAREGHDGLVGINYLEKIQTPTLPSLFGAMLAGVDYVLMGAGIPRAIPGVLDRLAKGESVELALNVVGATHEDSFLMQFDPSLFCSGEIPWLQRPKFLAIVASATLASVLARKSSGKVDGFIVEGPTAGGHNAPPRGKPTFNGRGEPLYGQRDAVSLDAIDALGLPFWLAGAYGSPAQIRSAIEAGATGVQVGTAFAFCDESGMLPELKREVIEMCVRGDADVVTDPLASPTGFPFKVLRMKSSMSEASVYEQRERVCDLGYLREAYRRNDGTVGWRCPGEKINAYTHKGGQIDDTSGRKCVCNGLLSNVGFAQHRRRRGWSEPSLVTCGDDVSGITQFLSSTEAGSYSAADVVRHLLAGVKASESVTVP